MLRPKEDLTKTAALAAAPNGPVTGVLQEPRVETEDKRAEGHGSCSSHGPRQHPKVEDKTDNEEKREIRRVQSPAPSKHSASTYSSRSPSPKNKYVEAGLDESWLDPGHAAQHAAGTDVDETVDSDCRGTAPPSGHCRGRPCHRFCWCWRGCPIAWR